MAATSNSKLCMRETLGVHYSYINIQHSLYQVLIHTIGWTRAM